MGISIKDNDTVDNHAQHGEQISRKEMLRLFPVGSVMMHKQNSDRVKMQGAQLVTAVAVLCAPPTADKPLRLQLSEDKPVYLNGGERIKSLLVTAAAVLADGYDPKHLFCECWSGAQVSLTEERLTYGFRMDLFSSISHWLTNCCLEEVSQEAKNAYKNEEPA